MSPTRSSLHKVFLECLQAMLVPIVRLTLRCGLGYSEFAAVTRSVFIEEASEEFGIRGRPANISKVSAITGLPRKVISRARSGEATLDWSPDNEVSPINTIIHYWRYDEAFSSPIGVARDLKYDGVGSFSELARKYLGDIPASTIRSELLRSGIAAKTEDGLLRLERTYSFPEYLDEDFLRNAAFAIRHHAETLVHNASLVSRGSVTESDHRRFGRFERFAWSRRLMRSEIDLFQEWARAEGALFVERADQFIAEQEAESHEAALQSVAGIGVYFFRSDKAERVNKVK